jgi:hypothetical protein
MATKVFTHDPDLFDERRAWFDLAQRQTPHVVRSSATPGVTLGQVPTAHRRHAVTETPPVREALDELRAELGTDRVPMGELVILGARARTAELRGEREGGSARLRSLADRIRAREPLADLEAAEEVRRTGWNRQF